MVTMLFIRYVCYTESETAKAKIELEILWLIAAVMFYIHAIYCFIVVDKISKSPHGQTQKVTSDITLQSLVSGCVKRKKGN